ncbi:hypothetical protein I862_02735 [endosymbiont of Acanthamoeba sp. UWC8]|uniref:hypothetical protein n=1 Tax=endosymbiont of Acanthamoeba sp. UWC8 TaxID=86106 RepID=UPI0004D1D549|nr:hypothetical protein [endosymbiont of Acanthamoeba sp. UWC8]AIF81110.1 hypothetical protein I862_02735 [endosymbiont of Acanthamoeba sp. UWC8]
MNQEQLTKLLSAQKLTASTIRSISDEVMNIIELALIGDEEALEKLKLYNSKEHDLLTTFFKVSSLIIKIFPMEHRIIGTELVKSLEDVPKEEEPSENLITDADINVMKNYIERYEREKNKVH